MYVHVLRAAVFVLVFLTSFRLLAASPSAVTSAATSITTSSAVLNGAGVPNGEQTTGWFRISTTHPGSCSDTFGSRVPASGGTDLGSGNVSVPYSITSTGLSAGNTYYFCAIVSNASGTAFGSVLSFTVPAAPTVLTGGVTSLASSSATLQGSANPNASATTSWFRYSSVDPGACNDAFGTRAPTSGGSALGSGTSPVDYTRAVSSLSPGTTYYYCAIASNAYGTSFGAVQSFTTLANAPVVVTNSASMLTGTTAQLNGATNPGGAPTTAWFRYSTSSPGTCNDSFGTRAPGSSGSSLGSGNSSVPYAQAITGLSPATTYFYCAIAENSVGTSFGTVVSFTTPALPAVTTSPASSVTDTTAYLNGTANPRGAATSGYFRYSLTDPGTCNDTFGSRAPLSGGSSLGSGSSAVSYSQYVTGLSPNTTYYFCAIASNIEGTGFGAVLTFTTPAPPTATTSAATLVTSASASLNGAANPHGNAAYGYFRFSTTNPGACNDAFGTRAPVSSSSDSSLGSGSSDVAFTRSITGLTPSTTYYYCAIGRNSYGTAFGAVLSFTTQAALPSVTTSSATLLTGSTAQLNGTANPGGAATIGWFRYATASPGTCNDSFGTRAPAIGGSSLGSGNTNTAFSQGITGLSASTTYYYCAIAQNSVGTSFGAVVTFTTPAPPTVTTTAATSVSNSAAYLNGTANPNGGSTTGYFRYSATDPGTCNDSFGSRAPATGGSALGSGNTAVSYGQSITGLSAGTTYYFCAIGASFEGTGFGQVLSFTTQAAPDVTTSAATLVTSGSATLNGAGNPNGNAAYGYYRYSTASPGVCNDAFGTRVPASSSSDTYLGAGSSPVAFARALSGLLPSTTYYYCAIARNAYGTSFGAVLSFTTLAAMPSVTTNSASLLTGTTAQLNGTANPGGASTTGWFRYSTASPGACNDSFGTRAPGSGGASLGSGTSATPYAQGLTGLSPATTYYYCAIAENAVGTAFGSVVSFTTPAVPTVTTSAASSIADTSAYLNGSANPNGGASTGYFRYSLTDPGTCNDSFGSRAPLTGGSSLGSGSASVNYSQYVTGLSAGTTYYFCAIASSSEGTGFGQVLSFTTPAAPTVTTSAATLVTSSSATLNGAANPNRNASYGYYRYGTVNPGVCNDAFGTRAPASSASDTSLGAGSADVPFARSITGLVPATTYYYCAVGRNTYGTTFGAVLSFTTLAALPVVTTNSATLLTGSTAQLNGTANPGGAATTGWFRYATASPGTCNDSFGTRAPASSGASLGSGTSAAAYSQGLTGLSPSTTYYYCAIAQNSVGTAFGAVVTFTTPAVPTVTTIAASSITNTTAYLNGSAVPNGATSTGYFRYSTTDPGSCNDSFGSRAPLSGGSGLGSGNSAASYSQYVTGLSQGTTYYFCALATSGEGTGFGQVMSFTTPSVPTVTTSAATLLTSSTATLNGAANPNGNAAYGYYRYSTVSPGVCNDSFGTRAPASSASDTSLGAGSTDVSFARGITGLVPSTTYYFCAIGRNTYGTSFGAVLSFTTLAALPTVTTNNATLLTGSTAQLNGTANPGGATTVGWFRYSTVSPGTCNDTFGTRAPGTGGASLGSGTTSTPWSQGLTGLSPATTYYYCAIAENSVGTALGALVSFTTPSLPTVTTAAASSLGNTTAYLNGSANPNGGAASGYFRYSLTDPGSCNDSFGSRAPLSGGSSLGSGNSPVSYSQYVTGLSAGTTYYFCAIASSGEGVAFGAVLSFTTADVPTVTTSAATLVTSSSATLNGGANPNGNAAYGYYRYSTTNPVVCSDSFGTRAPASSASDSSLGAGSAPVAFARSITGLTPGTTYYYCALGRNSYGTGLGLVLSFTTPATQPTVTTGAASAVTTVAATLNATANPMGANTTGWFRFATASPGTCNDSFGTRAPASGGSSLGGGTTTTAYSQGITGLSPGTTYYYCAIAENSVGMSFGAVLSFSTTAPPTVSTFAATPVTATSATLNGSVNPNGYATTGWFRYATAHPGTCNTSFGTSSATSSLGSGSSTVALAQALTGLSPATTYYFCAIASSSIGTSLGEVLSFTTPAAPPTVTALAASDLTDTSAVLNATANPNGSATTGWFRYSATNPGTCNDSFGTRAPSTEGTSVGSGNTVAPFSMPIASLVSGTTYYYCALASSAVGTSVSSVLSFTTPKAPSVTSAAATLVTSTTATLNGSANPNASATTGWYRYATTSPGTCNDSFGTRAPASGGTSLGAGSSAVAFPQVVTGLSPATTYYFCAIAENAVGIGFGAVLSFTTSSAPTVTTAAATVVAGTTATLNGSANPNLTAATGWFRYSTTNPGTCSDAFGTRAPASGGTALGAGASPVAYSQALTGLLAGTTYYYCAIASSAVGTGFGEVLSFTTAAAPTVTTAAATGVTSTGATFNGAANPNGLATTGWFRYSTVNPGSCTDTFGTRAPASGGAALGAGQTAVPYSQAVTALASGTTYYYCAIASNSLGTRFGTVLTFATPAAPSVTSAAATAVTSTGATLNGSANPNQLSATGWFRYSTTNPGGCNDSFGTRAPATGGTALGAGGAAVPYSEGLTGLAAGTTYYFCAIAQNAVGTGFGSVLSFTTPAAPQVTSTAASAVTSTGATLNGSANPRGSASTGWFRYSTANPGGCDDSFGTRAPATGGTSLGAGSSAVAFTQAVTGLAPATTYYFCAIAENAVDKGFGAVLSFTTAAAPAVTTAAASGVTGAAATLNGSANPNLLTSTGWFRYSATQPAACNDTFGTRAPLSGGTALGAGASPVSYAQSLTGLLAGTTYYYCAIASNSAGTGLGEVMSFTTAAAPSVTTESATDVASTTATLNGSASPNLLAATGWFRYSTTNPGNCNDVFGVRAPASGGASLGAGGSAVGYSQSLTGLQSGTTYYYCAIASNSLGTRFGAVLSLTTAAAPTVTTVAASDVTSTTAMLNATANPNLTAATGWFRFSTTHPGSCNDSFGTRAPATGGTSLGAGAAPVPYGQALTGLTAGVTYYFCAIAESSVGTGLGQVLSFATPQAPSVTSAAASAVTSTAATLNGSANPNLGAATGWFRYATTHPGACDDSFGTRAPATGGTPLGAGSSPVAFAQPLTGLAPATTYYFCAIADNAVGTGFGAVLSFTTTAAPAVTTGLPSGVSGTAATLHGAANPNLTPSSGWFRYSTVSPGTCNDNFGIRVPTTGGTPLGAGSSPVDFSQPLTSLSPGTSYYYCAIASNSVGTSFGAVVSFTTPAAPTVTSQDATSVTSDSATLNGTADPNLGAATGWFRFSTTHPGGCNDAFGTRAPASGGASLGAGSSPVPFAEQLAQLTPATTYYFCAIAENALGTSFGNVLSFTTPGAPSVTTQAPTGVSSVAATLNASANPNLLETTGWFRYSTTDPGTCNETFGTRAPELGGLPLGAGPAQVPYQQDLTGLLPGTTYYYCALASNSVGVGFGAVLSFTTPAAPAVTTEPATAVSSAGALLHGTANPNLATATGWFRFSTTDPGACDDSFGTRAPTAGGFALGDGSAPLPYFEALTGLAPMTTYYYCAIAENAAGKSYGAVLSFSTTSEPTVKTKAATDLTSTAAKLNGSANPNKSETTGWFRYSETEPGACDDKFGTRVPATGGTAVGSGTSEVDYAESITGLKLATAYYFCAIASSQGGTSFGEVLKLTTLADPPSVTTEPATNVKAASALLNGSANPNGEESTGWFRYDTKDPGACDDTFGVRAPATGGTKLPAGLTPAAFSQAVSGLDAGTKYYFCAVASNSQGKRFGAVLSFEPGAVPPVVTTEAATDLKANSATIAGKANPNGAEATGWFRLGETDPGTCSDAFGKRVPASGGVALGEGTEMAAFTQPLTGLEPNRTYFYCAAASNVGGATFGNVLKLTTAKAPPAITTKPASVTGKGAVTLNGAGNPNGTDTTAWFRYDSVNPGSCHDMFGTRVPSEGGKPLGSGLAELAFSESVEGLAPGTWYVCAIGSNGAGPAYGEVLTFELADDPPVMIPPAEDDGGCGCRVASGRSGSALSLAALLLLALRRRRRRA